MNSRSDLETKKVQLKMFLEEVNTKLENMELTLNQLKEENRFAFLFDTSLSVLFLKELGHLF